jgi:hypothetical protein
VALFFALGRFNPLASWLFALPGLRYPVKLILPAALGLTLLAGLGFDAALVAAQPPARRRAGWTLAAAALVLAVIAAWTLAAPPAAERTLAGWMNDAPSAVAAASTRLAAAVQRARWAQAALASLALAAGLGLALRLARARPAAGAALLLVLHAGGQWLFLHPLAPTDAALPYRLAPALLDEVAPELRLAHGASGRLFGSSQLYRGHYPDDGARWPVRRAFHELYPLGAALWDRDYSLDLSPEGLSSFETTIAREAVIASSDDQRLRLLAAWGVDRLLLDRPLAPAAAGMTTTVTTMPSFGGLVTVHALPTAAPPVRLSYRVRRVDGPQEAFAALTDPEFDPQRELVLEGDTLQLQSTADTDDGTVEIVEDSAERFKAEVSTPSPAVLALRRSYLTLYRATVDGQPATPRIVNMHQLGLTIPPGTHQVHLWINRRPLQIASGASLLGLLVLLILTLAPAQRHSPNHRSP